MRCAEEWARRREACARALRAGMTTTVAAQRSGVSRGTAIRIQAELGLATVREQRAAARVVEEIVGFGEENAMRAATARASDALLADLRAAHAAPPPDARAPREPLFRAAAADPRSGCGSPAAMCAGEV